MKQRGSCCWPQPFFLWAASADTIKFIFLLLVLVVHDHRATATGETFKQQESSVKIFTNADGQIQNIALHPETGNLYVGATNSIVQLRADGLLEAHRYVSGPAPDSPFCSWDGQDCIQPPRSSFSSPSGAKTRNNNNDNNRTLLTSKQQKNGTIVKTSTPNINQVLLVYPEQKSLIACGTLHQGICSVHLLTDIRETVHQRQGGSSTSKKIGRKTARTGVVPVAGNSVNASTVAFIGRGRLSRRATDGAIGTVLYVGATFSFPYYRDTFPAVATRSLHMDHLFDLVDPGDVTGRSGLDIRAEYRADFRIQYIGGFHSDDGFAYWATVQRSSPTVHNAPYVSKLIRICESDLRYESYAELPLECLGSDNSKYGLLQSVHVAEFGSETVKRLSGLKPNRFLIGIFSKGSGPDKIQHESGICVFSMQEIHDAFAFNAHRCKSGIGTRNLPHFGSDQKCLNMSHIREDGNGNKGSECFMGQLGGTIPATNVASITFKNSRLTSVTSSIVRGKHTVLFVGTSDGRVKKIHLKRPDLGIEYDQITLTLRRIPIGQTLLLSGEHPQGNHRENLFGMFGNKVFKTKVEQCEKYDSCLTCVQSRDPYCGWCTLYNRCSTKSQCPADSAGATPNGWIFGMTPGGGPGNRKAGSSRPGRQCPRLLQPVQPSNVSLFEPMTTAVRLKLKNLPPLGPKDNYSCQFGADSELIDAKMLNKHTIQCHLPTYDGRIKPAPRQDVDHVSKVVGIVTGANGIIAVFIRIPSVLLLVKFVRATYSFFGSLDGLWNDYYFSFALQDIESRLHGQGQQEQQQQQQQQSCPRINSGSFQTGKLIIAHGQRTAIKLPMVNFIATTTTSSLIDDGKEERLEMNSLECSIKVGQKRFDAPASVDKDGNVDCEPQAYRYNQNASHITAELSLRNGPQHVIDKTPVKLYKCQLMGSDCSSCISLPSEYGCTWCGEGQCRYSADCPLRSPLISDLSDDLEEDDAIVCPPPVITRFSPKTGPVDGGTRVVIHGRDLGTGIGQVRKRIFIANRVPCNVVDYTLSKKIVCVTSGSGGSELSGEISVIIGGRKAVSRSQFQFVRPIVYNFTPKQGPMSGGTKITVHGSHLDSGTITRIWLGSDSEYPCHLGARKNRGETVTSERITCVTSASLHPNWSIHELRLQLDWCNLTIPQSFRFLPDPVVHRIDPLDSWETGGRPMRVYGESLNATRRPQMYLIDSIRAEHGRNWNGDIPPVASELTPCTPVNATYMECRSPKLIQQHFARRSLRAKRQTISDGGSDLPKAEALHYNFYATWPIGFKMDNVQSVRNMGNQFQIRLFPDPEMYGFGKATDERNDYRVYRENGDPLILAGNNLNLIAAKRDYQVFIGSETCNVTLLSKNELFCRPPVKQPEPTDSNGNFIPGQYPLVTVKLGNLKFVPGHLAYASESPLITRNLGPISDSLFGTLVGLLIFLGVVAMFCCFLCHWKRKNGQEKKEYKQIQMQIENLETNVRLECKQAFAELQTDMSDLTSDLFQLGVPFHTKKMYAAKLLFDNNLDEWERFTINQPADSVRQFTLQSNPVIQQFQKILWTQESLLELISSLDSLNLPAPDASKMAALLTVSLMNDVGYMKDISLELLAGDQPSSGPNNPNYDNNNKSISTRFITNWISLCLFDYIQEETGSTLFLLMTAIKRLIERGPLDAVTGHARYSLDEGYLLKTDHANSNAMPTPPSVWEKLTLNIVPSGSTPTTTEDPEDGGLAAVQCTVLSCDTIGQVKGKILDALYRNAPFSTRPAAGDFDLEWRRGGSFAHMAHGASCSIRLFDLCRDQKSPKTMPIVGSIYGGSPSLASHRLPPTVQQQQKQQLNTLQSYGVHDQAYVTLVAKTVTPVTPAASSNFKPTSSCQYDPFEHQRQNNSTYASIMTSNNDSDNVSTSLLFIPTTTTTPGTTTKSPTKDEIERNSPVYLDPASPQKYWHLQLLPPTTSTAAMAVPDCAVGLVQRMNNGVCGAGPGAGGSDSGMSTMSRGSRQGPRSNHYHDTSSLLGGGGTPTKQINKSPVANVVPEIYLTRLLTSKGTVQRFIDDFIRATLTARPDTFPLVLKYLFDHFRDFDHQTAKSSSNGCQSDVFNQALLRFWSIVMNRSDVVVDVERNRTVEASLSLIHSVLEDAFASLSSSGSEATTSPGDSTIITFGKEHSPTTNKLLFAKDIPRYQSWAAQFRHDIQNLPPVTESDFSAYSFTLSKSYASVFNVPAACLELIKMLEAGPSSRWGPTTDFTDRIRLKDVRVKMKDILFNSRNLHHHDGCQNDVWSDENDGNDDIYASLN